MASGMTTTTAVVNSIPTIIASARIVAEQVGTITKLCDRQTLGKGIGLTWNEVSFAKLTASAVSETTVLDNYQQIDDSLFTITPTVVGITTFITDRVQARISSNAYAQMGGLAQNAIERKKEEDGVTVLDGATTSLCGAGSTLTTGHISAAKVRISSNVTEPWMGSVAAVLHGYQIKDLQDELVAGVGTYAVPDGVTADVFKNGFTLPVAGVSIYEDGCISIDSDADAKGGVFASGSGGAIVLVQGRAPRVVAVRKEEIGGGGTAVYHYDEYAYGERSAGNWLYEIFSDATVPTA